jgi:nucleoside-diphosphate-sugar epimerase
MDHPESERHLVVVTGANGFLGSKVVKLLVDGGRCVRATDRVAVAGDGDAEFIAADICNPDTLVPALRNADTLIHAAGLAHVFDHRADSAREFDRVNVQGTVATAETAVRAGVTTMVLISSVSVYGRHGMHAVDESVSCRPDGPYAVSKYVAERRAIEIARSSGMNLTILRLATLYGEGDPGNINRLFRAIDRRRFLWIGDGSNRKSLIHRDDAAAAVVAAALAGLPGIHVFNVASHASTVRQIVETIAGELNRPVPKWRIPGKPALRVFRLTSAAKIGGKRIKKAADTLSKWLADDVYDGSRFAATIPLPKSVGLSEGIRRQAAWFQNKKAA